MPNVSINWLYRHTGKDRRTIEKRVNKLHRDDKGKLDCAEALEAIYCGQIVSGNGEFVPTPEAIRQLTVAKKQEIDLDMEIKRQSRIPIEDCLSVDNEVLQAVAGTIKANHNKILSDPIINEIFGSLRDWANRLNGKHE